MRQSFFRKPKAYWVRLVLGMIFIVASLDKILHPAVFAQAIYNYQILPGTLINMSALILPWLELLLGIFLLLGWWLPGVVVLTNLLLVMFFGALVFNLARGLNIICGCFSTSTEGDPATTWYLIRDSAFLLMGGYLLFNLVVRRRPKPQVTGSS